MDNALCDELARHDEEPGMRQGDSRPGVSRRWEYCIVSCTPMPPPEEGGARIVGQIFAPAGLQELDLTTAERSPLDAIVRVLNRLGQEGWELVEYDTSTNRGVFKRPAGDGRPD